MLHHIADMQHAAAPQRRFARGSEGDGIEVWSDKLWLRLPDC